MLPVHGEEAHVCLLQYSSRLVFWFHYRIHLSPLFPSAMTRQTIRPRAVLPYSAETSRLFRAVRDGKLSAVQQAVIDGADLLAVNADNLTAAELAESLGHFTITHFLRAYQAIEERTSEPTTIVETDEPAPAPLPEEASPEETVQREASVSGEGIIPRDDLEPIEDTPSPSDQANQVTDLKSVATPVSELPEAPSTAILEEPAAEAGTESLKDYFSRLSVLNPSHTPKPPVSEAPSEAVEESGSEILTAMDEPAVSTEDLEKAIPLSIEGAEIIEAEPEAVMAEDEDEADILSQEGERVAFDPNTPPRKPAEDMTGEASIFTSVEKEDQQPEIPEGTVEEVDVPMLAEIPEIPEPSLPELPSDDESGFFAQMRIFDEGTVSPQPPPVDEPDSVARNTELLPEYERIRAAVIEKLRKESNKRSQQLADVREQNIEETEKEDMIREHLSGTQNIQTELRAKQRAELTGSALPPGYVPPPDGGSSGVRFLQRLGLFDPEEAEQIAQIQDMSRPQLPSGTSSYEQPTLMEAGETLLLPELSPGKLAKKSLAFVDHGYSAPPAGRSIDTAEDNAVAALGQIARLFQSPNIGYPSQTSALPQPGALPQAVTSQGNLGANILPQAPSEAPLSSSDLASPPPMSSLGNEIETTGQPVSVPEIPVSPADLAQLGIPEQQPAPSWDVTSTDNQGNIVHGAPTPGDGASGGFATQLSQIFSQPQPGAETSQQTAITGSWDVVSVQSAPTAARTLLGGAVVPKTSSAVAAAGILSMGQTVVLGKAPPIGVDPTARKKACIDKRRGAVLFCIEKIDWPQELENFMQVDTVMYQGLNAIVRYDNGVATRFHALFPSESFNNVVSYYMQRLGNPTNIWRRTISPLAAPERENPTVMWQALNPHTQITSTLEIRQFDDTRGGFPDEKRGAVTLYSAHSGPIFPQVSAFELMRLHPGS